MKEFIKVMKALSDPNRVKIVKMLQHKTMCVCEMREALQVSQPTVSKSLKILEEASKKNYTHGRSPAGIAAACVYVSSRITDEELTQHQVACVAQVTEVTIRNRYKELVQKLDIEINV